MSDATQAPQFVLEQSSDGLCLRWLNPPPYLHKITPLLIDFVHGKHADRAARAGKNNEAIAKACGLLKATRPLHVLDATAGLGRDALVLAALGCQVSLQERQPFVAELLKDALTRLAAAGSPLAERLRFAGTEVLTNAEQQAHLSAPVDVVYLDPMYPKGEHKRDQKSAVKKDMQMFHALVGDDNDADALLAPALKLATQRVVVKRPTYADFLGQVKPNHQVISNKQRFDIYLTTHLS